jgi:tetratricopeptide (TPR) repeat protein
MLEKVSKIPEKRWDESGREQRFEVHRDTQALLAVQFEGLDQDEPECLELYAEFEEDLDQLVDYIARFYNDNGFVVRILFAKLRAGGNIREHTDSGKSLLDCHRVHIPIVTNEGSIISVGGEEKNMRVGEMWEIDNGNTHAVTNMGEEDRIHLIIDWMPNRSGHAVAEILAEDDTGMGDAGKFAEQLAEANRLHQSGQVEKAEALYREIIRSDGRNVAALNLLGLLCIQSDRFEQAVEHIQIALSEKPNDAQALSNIGYALKNLGRFDDAAERLRQSLVLAPGSAETLLDLGNVYIELQRPEDAIRNYENAIAIRPEFAEAHFNLGSAQLSISLFGSAIASFRKSLALKPDFAEARNKLRLAERRGGSACSEQNP